MTEPVKKIMKDIVDMTKKEGAEKRVSSYGSLTN